SLPGQKTVAATYVAKRAGVYPFCLRHPDESPHHVRPARRALTCVPGECEGGRQRSYERRLRRAYGPPLGVERYRRRYSDRRARTGPAAAARCAGRNVETSAASASTAGATTKVGTSRVLTCNRKRVSTLLNAAVATPPMTMPMSASCAPSLSTKRRMSPP